MKIRVFGALALIGLAGVLTMSPLAATGHARSGAGDGRSRPPAPRPG